MQRFHLAPALASTLAIAALLSTPLSAQAAVYQFAAVLSPSNEVGITSSVAKGLALLNYDDMGTATLTDDTFDFTMAVFGLSGGAVAGTAASAYHIHGAATTSENAPVRIGLDSAPFVSMNSGSTLLVGGQDIPAPLIPATAATGTNAGHPAMSFLALLQGELAYANVHTVADAGGATRGQFVEVNAVPEPASYALLLAGLGVVGLIARRRRSQA